MRQYAKPSLVLTVLLVSVPLWPQEGYRFERADVFARLSYTAVQGERTCIALSQDGNYRMERFVNPVIPNPNAVRLQGKTPEKQFEQLKTLLSDPDFRHVVGSHGGIMRQSAEGFGAEIVREDVRDRIQVRSTQRLQWLNVDGENPFPNSLAKVVNWMKHFEPTDAASFEYAQFPDACPAVGLRLLQPSVALNVHP